MAARLERRRLTARWLRQVAWWIWPELPTSWSDVPVRLRPAASQIARLTVAAVVSYIVANALYPGILDLTAPLTALLVVQASTVGTLRMGLVRVGAVLIGILVAVGVATYLGLSWWSLAAVIAASLVLAKVLRLGEQTLEAPISAMLILAVSAPGLAAEVRLANTLIGTLGGIVFTLLVPVPIPNKQASDAVRRVTRSQAALMDEVALTLGRRAPHPDEVQAWFDWTEHIRGEMAEAGATVQAAKESRHLNPRALAAANVQPGLRSALDRLERCLSAERALLDAIGREAASGGGESLEGPEGELRAAFAVVLDDVADGLRAFGDLIGEEYGNGRIDRADEALERTLDIVRETRAVLTELMLLEVDPREHAELWMLQGSVLAALDQVLRQLDVEQTERTAEPWLRRVSLPGRAGRALTTAEGGSEQRQD